MPTALLAVLVGGVWLALGRLGVAFVDLSLDWRYVAEQSRRGAPWPYRLAGVWGGMEGSLLLFAAIVSTALLLAVRRASAWVGWAALATSVTLVAIDLGLASPFERLDVPATQGFGLNPILEHPAMAIHPPLLYAGLAAAGAAAFAAVSAVDAARAWLRWSVGLLTAAMTLGAAWSYMEQGWGGYWAWDPVENTSLIVWLLGLLALHLVPLVSDHRLRVAAATAPWVLALLGAALVRSGRTPSVHGFAEQLGVGRALFVLAVVTAVAVTAAVVTGPSDLVGRGAGVGTHTSQIGPDAQRTGDWRPVIVALLVVATAVVIAGTAYPAFADVVGERTTAVRGVFYSRVAAPLALVAVPFLAVEVWRRRGWSLVAHAGMVVLIAGVGVSTFDRVASVPVGAGAVQRAAGVDVRNDGVTLVEGERLGTDEVVATLDVDGTMMTPRLVVFPDRGGRLAEVAVTTGWWTDTHAVLDNAFDNGSVVVTIQRRHGMWLVWLGATASAAGAIAADLARRRRSRTS